MILYPLIELQNGRCVSLFRGRMEEPQIWHVDPVEKAQQFAEAGAEWLHITDFDGLQGDSKNAELTREIIRSAGISVQLGGGFRSLTSVEEWLDAGLSRAVIGTLAVQQPTLVKDAAMRHPDQIVLAIDVHNGFVVSEGWRQTSALTASDVLRTFNESPLAAIIVTDIDADLDEAEDSLALITQIASETKIPVIARGLTRSLDDISRMKYVTHLTGAVIGRALFDHSIDLKEALEIAKPEVEKRAEFI